MGNLKSSMCKYIDNPAIGGLSVGTSVLILFCCWAIISPLFLLIPGAGLIVSPIAAVVLCFVSIILSVVSSIATRTIYKDCQESFTNDMLNTNNN